MRRIHGNGKFQKSLVPSVAREFKFDLRCGQVITDVAQPPDGDMHNLRCQPGKSLHDCRISQDSAILIENGLAKERHEDASFGGVQNLGGRR